MSLTDDYKFRMASDINELKNYNIQYLEGKLSDTCYQSGKLHIESNDILNELVVINSFGFITSCSQPQIKINNLKQRAFIVGILEKKLYNKIKKYFKNDIEIYIDLTTNNSDINLTIEDNEVYSGSIFTEYPCADWFGCNLYEDLCETHNEIQIIDLNWDRNTLFQRLVSFFEVISKENYNI